MSLILLAAILVIRLKSRNSFPRKNNNLKLTPVSTPDPDKDTCYAAYVALKNALSVDSGSGSDDSGSGSGDSGSGSGDSGSGSGDSGSGSGDSGSGSSGDRRKYKLFKTLSETNPLTKFTTECPTTYARTECKAAYIAIGTSVKVANKEIIDKFVKDCAVPAPEESGDFDILGFKSNNVILMLVMALTGFYFIL
jgi:hypothetical protein